MTILNYWNVILFILSLAFKIMKPSNIAQLSFFIIYIFFPELLFVFHIFNCTSDSASPKNINFAIITNFFNFTCLKNKLKTHLKC